MTYANDPAKLIASVEEAGLEVVWYVHHHGSEPTFAAQIEALSGRPNFRVVMHRENRGLSRSWNEGLRQAYDDGAELALLVNDDLHFVDDGFRKFVEFARTQEDYGLAFLHGLETGGSPYAGEVKVQGFACCVVTPQAIERIGWFDENFQPAYYEDFDYYRRRHLVGVRDVIASGVMAEHERSKTTRENPEVSAGDPGARNLAYYTEKWGKPGEECHQTPFGEAAYSNRISWEERGDPYPGRSPIT
ncbi:glycosyltransferase [Methylobacterium organophilum]|uniref:glycosyltransferase family 2 protein n=1 Tax=Methylobacterium organophilum TaxID=410 RepID=UPI001F146861|nr:glycosyltransferase [Methylobacterium organophilum]UMY15622.1 glycosyltransferase [Methylobacterium organophilum]